MTSKNPWPGVVERIILFALPWIILGLLFDALPWFLFAGCLVLVFWHYKNLYKLERWLRKKRTFQPPDASGIWGDVFYGLYQRQKQQRTRNRRLSGVLNRMHESTIAMPDGIVAMSSDGLLEWWNEPAENLLGLRWPADKNQHITNLIRNPRFIGYFDQSDYNSPLFIASPKNEQVRVEIRVVPYGNHQSMMVVRDVTQMTRLQTMRKDFVANVSHELRTPLTVLQGYLETMNEYGDDIPDEWKEPMQIMLSQGARMRSLIEELLMLSRLETGSKADKDAEVNTTSLLERVYNNALEINRKPQHNITLNIETDSNILGNDTELQSAFANLVNNAIYYTPPGGNIEITWQKDPDGCRFSVKDNGEGIASEHIPRLTERFYRIDAARSRRTGGTGLGLAIVKHVLFRHDADLSITSRLGKGSTFYCIIPHSRLKPSTATSESSTASGHQPVTLRS